MKKLLVLLVVFLGAKLSAGDVVIAENGKACMDIVVPDHAGYVVKMASEELKYFLKKSTGAEFKVVVESEAAGEKGIFLGNTKALQERADVVGFEPQQHLVKVENDAVFIAGKDDPRTSEIDLLTLLHYVGDKSTLYGVYSFLERFCGIRFFAPGEIGEFVPRQRRFAIKPMQILEKPYFSERNIADFTGYSMAKYPDASAYLTKSSDEIMLWGLRLKLSAKGPTSGCHSEQFFTKFFAKTHPEYFALQPDGTRNLRYFCWSNPSVIELWEKLADAYFSGKSPADADPALKELKTWTGCYFPNEFMIDPMDCAEKYICQCPDCQKFIAGRGEVGYGELIFATINKITAKIALKNPDKYISTLVYPPKEIFPKDSVIHKNLLVRYCYLIGPEQQAFEKDYSAELERLRQWSRAKGGKIPVHTYICSFKFGDVMPGLPDTCPHGFSRFLGDVADYTSGLFVEHYTPTLAMRSLDNYIEARLLWNPSSDVDVLLEEYFNKYYGPAGIPVGKFFDRLEIDCQRIMKAVVTEIGADGANGLNPRGLYGNRKYWQKFAWKNIYDQSEMSLLDQLLSEAEKKTGSPGDVIYKKRVALVRDDIYSIILKERNKSVGSAEITTAPQSSATDPIPRASDQGGMFFSGDIPEFDVAMDSGKEEMDLGMKFSIEKNGKIKAFHLYQARLGRGAPTFRLWGGEGFSDLLLEAVAPERSGGGWISVPLPKAFAVSAGDMFVLSYTAYGGIAETLDVFDKPIKRDGITAIKGLYRFDALGERAPDRSYRNCNYFIDVDYDVDGGAQISK